MKLAQSLQGLMTLYLVCLAALLVARLAQWAPQVVPRLPAYWEALLELTVPSVTSQTGS